MTRPAKELTDALRIDDLKPFDVGVRLTPTVTVENGVVSLEVKVDPSGKIKNRVGDTLVVTIPLNVFPDASPYGIRKWAHNVYNLILYGSGNGNSPISVYLLNQAAQNYLDISLYELGQSPEDIVEAHQKFMGQFYRQVMKLRWRRGNISEWSKAELEFAILAALQKLPSPRRTLPVVAQFIKKEYRRDTPKNGEALRKLLDRLELNWMALKRRAKTGG